MTLRRGIEGLLSAQPSDRGDELADALDRLAVQMAAMQAALADVSRLLRKDPRRKPHQ